VCESSLGSLGRRQELDRAAREQQAADGIPLRKQREVVGPGGATDPTGGLRSSRRARGIPGYGLTNFGQALLGWSVSWRC